jgi:tetratricopeptide (TPR) repeat protein
MTPTSRGLRPLFVTGLLALLGAQLLMFVSRQSQTWDEGDHIYAGYRSLKHRDFGLNPEHPPFVKMLATAPLLGMDLRVPELQNRSFKHEAFLGGRDFVFGNDADALLFRARLGPALLTLLLALVAFLAAREMFGDGAGFVTLALLAFDPNLIAHGALVTTDAGLSLFMLATAYAFYRYVKAPSWPRLALVGLTLGLAFATKHAAVLLPGMLVLLALTELRQPAAPGSASLRSRALRLLVALLVIGAIALAVLWAAYGFRYAARPEGLALNPPFADTIAYLSKPYQKAILSTCAQWHLLPESYLYGLADVFIMEGFYRSYLLGTPYPHGVWFYFPFAFVIKSSLAFLILPLVIAAAILTKRLIARREVLFLVIPPLVHFLVAMSAHMNIGVRHILPIYPFLAVLGGGALWAFAGRDRRWLYATLVLLAVHIGSSVRAFPAYMAYSNELWGGPTQTYKHLSDSNSDWAQQLKSLSAYLEKRGVRDCWFAYFAEGTVDWSYYGIPCKPLPTIGGFWLRIASQVPPEIEGTVVISAGTLSGFEFGPPALNPYAPFEKVTPVAQIDGGVFVYEGRFEIPLASALALAEKAEAALAAGRVEEALTDATRAVELAPDAVKPNVVLGDALTSLKRTDDARRAYEKALHSARTIEPDFQVEWIAAIEAKLAPPAAAP